MQFAPSMPRFRSTINSVAFCARYPCQPVYSRSSRCGCVAQGVGARRQLDEATAGLHFHSIAPGIAGSCVFLNYAVWESVAHFRTASRIRSLPARSTPILRARSRSHTCSAVSPCRTSAQLEDGLHPLHVGDNVRSAANSNRQRSGGSRPQAAGQRRRPSPPLAAVPDRLEFFSPQHVVNRVRCHTGPGLQSQLTTNGRSWIRAARWADRCGQGGSGARGISFTRPTAVSGVCRARLARAACEARNAA